MDDKLISGEQAGKIHTTMLQALRLHYKSAAFQRGQEFSIRKVP
jgi:hypothetical protein